ncbi:MAG TPA: hypothetical protein VHH36_07640 [Candidatus Thermoplasmatota archaeon]|nr:hypothetical protein [Candidatus Thermoplasmatota archaeon]
MKNKLLAGFLTLALFGVAPIAGADPHSSGEAPNSADDTETLAPGTHSGTITTGDEDWYRIFVDQLSRVTVTLSFPCGADFDLDLYQGDGETLIVRSDKHVCVAETTSCVATQGQFVYARVFPFSGTGSYSLSVSTAAFSVSLTELCAL